MKPTNQKPIFLNDLCTGGAKPRRSKYGAVKTEIDGIKFDSKKEARVYQQLKLMEKGGAVLYFERQTRYKFEYNNIKICEYRADFLVTFRDGHREIWDAKGVRTKEYIIKKKMMKAFFNIGIVEV
jgi:protein associated with RNAse G/E